MILRKFNDSEYEPHLQEFLKEYYAAEFPYFSFKNGCLGIIPRFPKLIRLGKCNLIRRSIKSKIKHVTPTSILFVNMSNRRLKVVVEGRCSKLTGCGIGAMGSSINMSVDPSENKKQKCVIEPRIYDNNFISKFRKKRWFHRLMFNDDYETSKKTAVCLSASSALIDPCTYTYYLTVYTLHSNGKEDKPLMEEILHHSNCDVIFRDKHVNPDGLEKWIKTGFP
ncbi:hypothetical protein BpV1_109 [Bathycoccus sp. RCC1105 virus BpV1]|jgi:hypothetical protein|uniref:hypothetical protein n=1 Tax=Bathycoccus sp. RCC1105 virus BpV1 TaxID=880159 RepID=UPI0001EF445F|nr:hypothetical protein BpV1_109 [Bathycoccus sp. RCC1105 virus BpV1]ADQ91736.1 hypothetical protein BpV1_109 [Bathycoccus sp. RCC1105 virus BpV1]|tara:strand:- start:255 stop:923 length:669 start_codon:yes stop_codon:yes gene_type:complete